jgi:hypothetical protein
MDSLDSLQHPQAWAAALALVDLSIAWLIATTALLSLVQERRRQAEQTASPSPGHRQRFA